MDNYKHPKSGMTYFSPSFTTYANPDRTVRIASKVIESPLTYAFAAVKDEMVLLRKEDAKTDIRATFYCDDRNISITGGLGPTAGLIWRLGLMGEAARPEPYRILLDTLEQLLDVRGIVGRFEEALQEASRQDTGREEALAQV